MNLLLLLLLQGEQPASLEVPNAMGAHTWFIILATGAFLAWSISYSLQLHRETLARRKGLEEMVQRREELIDEIADLEAQKEAGSITEKKYKQELKDLKFRLSKVVEKLGGNSGTSS